MSRKNETQILSSVKNAMQILKSFSASGSSQGVTELSRKFGLAKSTVSRILATLEEEGFVSKNEENQKYSLGLTVLTLGGIVTNNLDIHKQGGPVLSKLVYETGETSHIAILDNLDAIYIGKEECNHPVRILTHVGRRNPSYATSSGKVLLAFSDKSIVYKVIENRLNPYTKNTITDSDLFLQTLNEIYRDGYAVSKEEYREGIVSVAAPIKNYKGKVVSAVNIVGPSQRMGRGALSSSIKKVIKAGEEISERLGYDKRFLNLH